MTPIEKENCLDSMVILCDTREQPSERAERRYKAFGCPYRRQKLDFGDYSAVFTLPDGTEARTGAAIERKMDLDELAMCFTHDRKRFNAEFQRAKDADARMYLLIENASWELLLNGKYRSKFNPKAFMASMVAWMVRYNIKPVFCKAETSGRLIREILYREIKNDIEKGVYDNG